MPESTVNLEDHHEPAAAPESMSGTKLHAAYGQVAGAAVAAVAERGVMGLTGGAAKIANIAGVALLVMIGIGGLWQLRADALVDRADHRAQVASAAAKAEEQRKEDQRQNEERRKEDRLDRQRIEELFSRTLETISRDSRDAVTQMKIVSEQVKQSGEQMKAATDAMVRVEKLLAGKSIP